MEFKVDMYTKEALMGLFAFNINTDKDQVADKVHLIYFDRYLHKIDAKTILAEFDYIDHDYLEDFTHYYVKCFANYERKCIRLHFFREVFDEEFVRETLKTGEFEKVEKIRSSYLGFIVVKPLPRTVIGKTCLKTYPHDSRRNFPITRQYKVSLFGIDLSIESLAYQEQDSVAAACATSALWSVFHGTGVLFHHPIPSPVEITRFATENLPAQSRSFPNKGLTIEQMAHAIRKIGLEPYYVGVSTEDSLKSTVYAYLRAKIPLMMAFHIIDTDKGNNILIGGHAVTITGDSIESSSAVTNSSTTIFSRSSRISKFYVHDDQVGPFAKMEFTNSVIKYHNTGGEVVGEGISLTTNWGDMSGGRFKAIPFALLVPIYNKIRIPYELIQDRVIEFDLYIELFRGQGSVTLGERLNWDVFLSQINEYKKSVLNCPHIKNESRERILLEKMPRFLWRAIGYLNDVPQIELLFDATGIEQGGLFIKASDCNGNFFSELSRLSKVPAVQDLVKKSSVSSIFQWFINK